MLINWIDQLICDMVCEVELNKDVGEMILCLEWEQCEFVKVVEGYEDWFEIVSFEVCEVVIVLQDCEIDLVELIEDVVCLVVWYQLVQ